MSTNGHSVGGIPTWHGAAKRSDRGANREALHRLEIDGLVRRRTSRGVVVSDYSVDELGDLYLGREALEEVAARLAAALRSDTEVSLLHGALESYRRTMTGGDLLQLVEGNHALYDADPDPDAAERLIGRHFDKATALRIGRKRTLHMREWRSKGSRFR